MTSSGVVIVRAIIDLPEAYRARPGAHCRQSGLSRATTLREALALWLRQQQPDHQQVFGLWRDRSGDALQRQEALRRDWSGR